MDETILLPSPNWFLVSGMAVTTNGWVIYGSPSKSLCVLEPLAPNCSVVVTENGYRAHLFGKAHGDKITAIDTSPTWGDKKGFISGAADGSVKLWSLEKEDDTLNIKYKYSHSMHLSDREDVVGVGYNSSSLAITIGSYGRIVKWDLQSNIVKTYNVMLSKFKPTCMACSPHRWLHVAVGTKQGVVLVVDLNDTGTTIFKIRSHDDEILSVSWCPQYRVTTKKIKKETDQKNSANKRLEKIRQETNNQQKEQLDDSALTKTLPEDSFDETVVEEEDLFDVYKDHEDDEFGHKKYIPEVIVVKEKEAISTEFDYLTECQKLKDKITQSKEEPEPSITSLVEALDKTHVDDNESSLKGNTKPKKQESENVNVHEFNKQGHKHLLATIGKQGHLRVWSNTGKLVGSGIQHRTQFPNKQQQQKVNQPPWATVLWYKPDVLLITDAKGQLLQCNPLNTDSRNKIETRVVDVIHKRGTFCMISNAPRVQFGYGAKECTQSTQAENVNQTQTDSESLDSNQCQETQHVARHTVALPEDQWFVWTAAQDRTLVCYSMTKRKKISTYNTCGGFVYNLQPCPYDARKVVVCVGDGAIRVWEVGVSTNNDEKLTYGNVSTFWQNVQGKVLVAAWHPTRENIIAFGTAEARVGILDISGYNVEKPARVLNIGVSGSVYSVCWGEGNDLYVAGGGDIFMCNLKKETETKTISVKLDGEKWRLTAVTWYPSGMLCGTFNGSVALLSNTTYEIEAVNFLFKKLINSIEWHPQFTSKSSEESSFKNLIAVCSMDKNCQVAILRHSQNEDGKHQLETHMFLEGHKGTVMQLAWSPHDEGRLASTSSDSTVRVWDVGAGTCIAIFWRHAVNPISLAWSPFPQHSNVLISGGSDYCVRLWKLEDYPPEAYKETLPVPLPLLPKKERKKRVIEPERSAEGESSDRFAEEAIVAEGSYGEGREADEMAIRLKVFKKFLLPISSRQMNNCSANVARKLAQKVLEEADNSGDEDTDTEYDTDFIKIFGTTNEFNELLDYEMQCHLEAKDTDAWIMLAVFRGQIDSMIQFADENDLLCPFLVSIAPCVSFKYWKDVTQLYVGQINRFVAQKREHKLMHTRAYGGAIFRKAAMLLAVHDVRGAVDCLVEARLFRDAFMLCRARHMENIARETLLLWLRDAITSGHLKAAIICYIVLGEMYKASTIIAGLTKEDESWLSLAADLAKTAGQHTFAGHLEDKKEQIKQAPNNQEEVEDDVQQLPTRMELFLRNNLIANSLKD